MLWAVDCPSDLHQGFCRGLCLGSVPRDSVSRVPGRLDGPRLLGGHGHKGRSGSALALSLPRDRDTQGEVRSRTLEACTLPRCDHRFWCCRDFPAFARVEKCLVFGRRVILPCLLPLLSFAGAFGHLISLAKLVPHSRLCMRSLQWDLVAYWSPESDPPSLPVPLSWVVWWIFLCGWCGPIFSTGFFVSGHRLRICTCIRTRLGRDGAHTSSIVLCLGCDRSRGRCSTSIFSI